MNPGKIASVLVGWTLCWPLLLLPPSKLRSKIDAWRHKTFGSGSDVEQ